MDKITDKAKMVTDPVVLGELYRQGIDKDYVEFERDYSAQHPTTKFYRDLKSDKRFMVFSQLPMVYSNGEKAETRWQNSGEGFESKSSMLLVSAQSTNIEAMNRLSGSSLCYRPQVFLGSIEQSCSAPILLATDPINSNYTENVIEWDYGVCKRWLRIIEGQVQGLWIFGKIPDNVVRFKYNQLGSLRLNLGQFATGSDEELVRPEDFRRLAFLSGFPLSVSDSLTVYSTTSDGRALKSALASGGYAAVHDAAEAGSVRAGEVMEYVSNYIYWSPQYYEISRAFLFFDTSPLGATAVISAASLSLRGAGGSEGDADYSDVCLVEGVQGDPIVVANYGDELSKTAYGVDAPWTFPIATGDYTAKSLNATGLGWISKTGTTKFCLRLNSDISNSTPTGENYSGVYMSEKGNGYKPKLVVTYSVSAFVPRIASIF